MGLLSFSGLSYNLRFNSKYGTSLFRIISIQFIKSLTKPGLKSKPFWLCPIKNKRSKIGCDYRYI
jgi:hypothetical protein